MKREWFDRPSHTKVIPSCKAGNKNSWDRLDIFLDGKYISRVNCVGWSSVESDISTDKQGWKQRKLSRRRKHQQISNSNRGVSRTERGKWSWTVIFEDGSVFWRVFSSLWPMREHWVWIETESTPTFGGSFAVKWLIQWQNSEYVPSRHILTVDRWSLVEVKSRCRGSQKKNAHWGT